MVDNQSVKRQGTPLLDVSHHFEVWMSRMGYARSTIVTYTTLLENFLTWVMKKNILQVESLTQDHIEAFVGWLQQRKNLHYGGGLSDSYIFDHLTTLKLLDSYLQKYHHRKLLTRTISITEGIPTERKVLTQDEIKSLYHITGDDILGYRDRAILSLCYGCGLRGGEVTRITTEHLCYRKSLLEVLPGKNFRGRFIPLSAGVERDLQAYQRYSRPILNKQTSNAFIIGYYGAPMKRSSMCERINHIGKWAKVNKPVNLHVLRHSIATHLLAGGMALQQIARFLGHASLQSTQGYTRIDPWQ